ncbi:hypothetical protein ACGF5Q_24575 [Streptomyces huasconensis]|uniref:hypothetical protein n=1 Tax=Streptomyces huasconensis TaxID=1854574 RepID=UPI00371011E4
MSDRLSPQREAEIRKHIAELVYSTYGQRDTERTLAIVDAVMPAVRAGVAAELAAVRAERDEAQAAAERLKGQRSFLLKQIQKRGARSGEADAVIRQFLSGDEDVFVPRTERAYWVDIAAALNAAEAAGMPVGIDLDGTLTDNRAWSVIWDREAKKWAVAGYDAEEAAS